MGRLSGARVAALLPGQSGSTFPKAPARWQGLPRAGTAHLRCLQPTSAQESKAKFKRKEHSDDTVLYYAECRKNYWHGVKSLYPIPFFVKTLEWRRVTSFSLRRSFITHPPANQSALKCTSTALRLLSGESPDTGRTLIWKKGTNKAPGQSSQCFLVRRNHPLVVLCYVTLTDDTPPEE